MTSQELGDLFEKASFEILKELFQNWGFQITDSKIQESGTQFGFDEFFKIYRENCSLNIYVECKASQKYNSISSIELKDKIEQLEWIPFPKKDVHILFSPSRKIKFSNRETTIEDNSYPFVIIDWMRKPKPNLRNLVMELFASYQGENEVIKKYRDFLLNEIDKNFTTNKTFAEVCEQLKVDFERRISEHHAETAEEDYKIINGAFWQRTQQNTDFTDIHYYYTKIDSNRLPQVVANDFYVRNEQAIISFDNKFEQAIKHRKSLIKILSQGGEGKSTFLYHLAKTLCEENTVVWLYSVAGEVFGEIRRKLEQIITQKPLVFILDNPASFGGDLERFAEKLVRVFDKHKAILIVAERSFRYQEIAERDAFEPLFDEVFDIYLRSTKIAERVFGKLMEAFQKDNFFSPELIAQSKAIFLKDENLSIAEKTFSLIKYLSQNDKLRGYIFDWKDWENFADNNAPKLKNLYLLLATFYQFGNSLDIEFCVSFLPNVGFIEINSALGDDKNLPIYKRGRHLFLRHEKLASWYLENKTHLQNSKHLFEQFLKNINTGFARNLFIWLCVKNKEFRTSEYAQLVDTNKRAEIFKNYIDQNPKELKSRTELSKIYQQQRKWKEAEKLLKEYIELDPNGLHPRTELSKIYQQQRKWKEAEDILLEEIKIAPEALHPRTELSKIYQQQRKWKEAIRLLKEYLNLNPQGDQRLHPRTELSKIYQQQQKWKEAEDILFELLDLDKRNLQARTELSKIYQQQRKWKEAEDILFELLDLDKQNLQARTELSKIYQQQQKWKEAEDILFELLDLDKRNLQARTELSKIYQQQRKWKEAEDILLECLEIDKDDANSLLELGKIRGKDRNQFEDTKKIFKGILDKNPFDIPAKMQLAILYRDNNRRDEAKLLYFEILKDEPSNIFALNQVSRIFKRYKKFRVSIKTAEELLSIKETDLLTIFGLIETFVVTKDKKNIDLYLEIGEKILKEDKNHKHKEKFQRLRTDFDESVKLIDFYKVGHAIKENEQRFVKAENGERFIVPENATVNHKIIPNQKVYFGVYSKDGETFADFVEPYFENIDDLEALK
jgi:tetratricopeptide (TPR) repeat protein